MRQRLVRLRWGVLVVASLRVPVVRLKAFLLCLALRLFPGHRTSDGNLALVRMGHLAPHTNQDPGYHSPGAFLIGSFKTSKDHDVKPAQEDHAMNDGYGSLCQQRNQDFQFNRLWSRLFHSPLDLSPESHLPGLTELLADRCCSRTSVNSVLLLLTSSVLSLPRHTVQDCRG